MKHNQRFYFLKQPISQKKLSIILIRLLLVCIWLLFAFIIGYFVVGDISFFYAMAVRAFCVSLVKFLGPCAFPFHILFFDLLSSLPGDCIMRSLPAHEDVMLNNEEEEEVELLYIDEINHRIMMLNETYSQIHQMEILRSDSAWRQEVDNQLFFAQQQGIQPAFFDCYNKINKEICCITLEARLRNKLFDIISTDTEVVSSSDTQILNAIKNLISTRNLSFRPHQSLEHNTELQAIFLDKLFYIEGQLPREDGLYREIVQSLAGP